MTLPNDVDRCAGDGYQEDDRWDWREGCEDCLRRTSPGGDVHMEPPPIIVFECEYRIAPGEC
jgi:hypothetical protein